MTTPTRRDRMKPLELVIISLIIGVFGGLIVLMSTREPLLSLISLWRSLTNKDGPPG